MERAARGHRLMAPTTEEVRDWVGSDVLDAEGHELGRLIGAYLDDAGRPAWLAVEIDDRVAAVPAAGAEPAGNVVRAAALAADVRLAPRIARDEPLAEELEPRLRARYGPAARSVPQRPEPARQVDAAARDAIVSRLREAYSLEAE